MPKRTLMTVLANEPVPDGYYDRMAAAVAELLPDEIVGTCLGPKCTSSFTYRRVDAPLPVLLLLRMRRQLRPPSRRVGEGSAKAECRDRDRDRHAPQGRSGVDLRFEAVASSHQEHSRRAVPGHPRPGAPRGADRPRITWPGPFRLVHATAPSFLGNSYIGTVAEGYPLARVPLIRVRMRSRTLFESGCSAAQNVGARI